MFAIIKGIPFCFSLLMEIFKTHEGGIVKPATKLIVLSFAAFLTYSTYITLIYVEQYHILVKQQYHVEYLTDLLEEKRDLVVGLKQDIDELEYALRAYRVPPPNSSYHEPSAVRNSPGVPSPPEKMRTPPQSAVDFIVPDIFHPIPQMSPAIKGSKEPGVLFRRNRKEKEEE